MEEKEEQKPATENTEPKENNVPYFRFKDVTEKLKIAEENLKKFEEVKKTEAEKILAEQNEFKKLAELKAAEIETMKKEFEAEKQKAAEERTNYELMLEAKNLGMADPHDALALVNREILSSDDGIKKALEELRGKKPYLFAQAKAPGVHTDKVNGTATPMTKEQLVKDGRLAMKVYTEQPELYKKIMYNN
jgi:hypothetical protein